ncbi:beta-mannanase [Paenibacillus glufosinatiresistens]|uniref:beta-mannanase n=1 Tax=Paenibacillus glufosinatiresistens TaxID=3070657 RepID=UPI00286DB696|nr:beta-mannanase [Paenibacillus sp. YX.27]
MEFIEPGEGRPAVSDLKASVEDRVCTLRWHWPKGAQAVCIAKMPEGAGPDEPPGGYKLYTREEYKAAGGYRDRMEEIGPVRYAVYVRLSDEEGTRLVRRPDGGDQVTVGAGKARIGYSVHRRRGLLRKSGTAQITVTAETPVDKDVLCYVKKRGGYPQDKEDGIRYPFVRDFAPGVNALPPIEIGPDDYIRLFFTDGPRQARYYELVPE